MNRFCTAVCCLLAALLPLCAGCSKKSTTPEIPQIANPVPGPGASPQEVERYHLEEEKRSLSSDYVNNINRIQQINARLIQLNIAIRRQSDRP